MLEKQQDSHDQGEQFKNTPPQDVFSEDDAINRKGGRVSTEKKVFQFRALLVNNGKQ